MRAFAAARVPALAGLSVVLLASSACRQGEVAEAPIRLVDRFAEATLTDEVALAEPGRPVEWTFAGGVAAGGEWTAGPRTAAVRVTDDGLTGRATGPQPAIILTLPEPAGAGDRLHEIVVRLKSDKGNSLSLTALGADGPPTDALVGPPAPLSLAVPLIAGEEFKSYTITLDRAFGLGPLRREGEITRVLLRPTDAPGAEFTISSVRLIFRDQYLAGIPSGIGWRGLAQVWRDTVVSRAPETVTWNVELPSEAWLDVAFGTVSTGAVGFDVSVSVGGTTTAIHEETLTTLERWEPRRIDLSEWSGETVDLSLSARGEDSALAFWGSPVVRSGWIADRAPAAPKGVIVVLADTLRKHHLALYGHDRPNTPHLEAMAEEGVVFSDAISQATWTKVSVPSLLSSLYPTTHQIVTFNDRLPSAAVTLAEAFQNAGFATWASSSVPFSGQLTNLHQGVEVLHEETSVTLPDGVSDSKTGRYFINELTPWLERHRDVPFFAFVHAMDPHSPFEPYAPYDTLWTDAAAKERWERDVEKIEPHIVNPLLRRFGMPTRAEMEAAKVDIEPYIEHEKAWYDASILALDEELGRLREVLKRLGRDRDTVIAFVSDHGEEFLEHGNHWHGLNVYAEMIEVPLVFHGPGLPGSTIDTTVQTLDMMPTLLDLAGLPIPETAQGMSLRPLWSSDGESMRRPPAIAVREAQMSPNTPELGSFLGSDSIAIVESEWKLIWNTRANGVPEIELFHRPSDPLDQTNVATEHPDVVQRLRDLLDRWHEAAIAGRLPSDAEAAENLSAEDLERLQSLGYL